MSEKQNKIYNQLCNMSGTQVVNILTDIHGMQILDDEVYHELCLQGYFDEEEDEEEN